jgi:hypothetical protein
MISLGNEEQARLAEIIRDVRSEMRIHPQLSREMVVVLIVSALVETIKESDPEHDTKQFLEACYK